MERKEYLPLTYGQRWFVREMVKVKRPGWYTIDFLVRTKTPMDEKIMEQAVLYLVNKYESLRVKMVPYEGEWIQEIYPSSAADPFAFHDLTTYHRTQQQQYIRETCIRARDAISLEKGNLVKIVYFRFPGEEGRIWFCMHHLIADFMTALVLTGEFIATYNSLLKGKELKWQVDKEYRKWLYLLEGYIRYVLLPSELHYWTSLPWHKVKLLPSDYPETFHKDELIIDALRQKKILDTFRTASQVVDQELTLKLFSKAGGEFEQLLIAVFFLALVNEKKVDWLDINIANSGRTILPDDYGINTYRLLGYMAMARALLLQRPPGDDLWENIQLVTEQIRNTPNAGLGYFLLRDHIRDEAVQRSYDAARIPCDIYFNYTGRVNTNFSNDQFETVEEDTGRDLHVEEFHNALLVCFVGVKQNQLVLRLIYSNAYFKESTMNAILQNMQEMFRAIVSASFIEKVA